MTKPNDPSNEGNESRSKRRAFSVSKGFQDVHTILDNLPDNEMSRFVCEAIRHYHTVKTNPNWMSEQLQSAIATTTQLQNMLAFLGGQPASPGIPAFPQSNVGGFVPQPAAQPPSHIATPYAETQMDDKAEEGSHPLQPDHLSAHEVVERALEIAATAEDTASSGDALAVEREDRYAGKKDDKNGSSNENAGGEGKTTSKPPRRRSSLAQGLADKSMGVKTVTP